MLSDFVIVLSIRAMSLKRCPRAGNKLFGAAIIRKISRAHVIIAQRYPFVGGQFAQTHGTAGV
jgi:hypothetical protein